jgi:hypothetical protein
MTGVVTNNIALFTTNPTGLANFNKLMGLPQTYYRKQYGLSCPTPRIITPVISASSNQETKTADSAKPAISNNQWNQSSDRMLASVQLTGGKGCDIKHNSYDRYLNKLKRGTRIKELKDKNIKNCCAV